MYNKILALKYLELLQATNANDIIPLLKSAPPRMPEQYRKFNEGRFYDVNQSFENLKDRLPQFESMETVMMLGLYQRLVTEAAEAVFGKKIDFPVVGSLFTMDMNASFCVPNKNINASFLLFNVGMSTMLNCISTITTALMINYDFPNTCFNVNNKSDKKKLNEIVKKELKISTSFATAVSSFFNPSMFTCMPKSFYATENEIQLHTEIFNYSCFFIFAHEYIHHHFSHISEAEKAILVSNLNIDIHKREQVDEYAADYYALLLLEYWAKKMKLTEIPYLTACISISQIFTFLYIAEGYKKKIGIFSPFETHPHPNERFENIKAIVENNASFVKHLDVAHEFVSFSLFILNTYHEEALTEYISLNGKVDD